MNSSGFYIIMAICAAYMSNPESAFFCVIAFLCAFTAGDIAGRNHIEKEDK